jgi:hypothetical protein
VGSAGDGARVRSPLLVPPPGGSWLSGCVLTIVTDMQSDPRALRD